MLSYQYIYIYIYKSVLPMEIPNLSSRPIISWTLLRVNDL